MHDSALVCFKNYFRLLDIPLFEVRLKKKVIPVFIYDPSALAIGIRGASKWWLHSPLRYTEASRFAGGRLILRKGSTASILRELVESTQASSVYWNRRYLLSERTVDAVVKEMLWIWVLKLNRHHCLWNHGRLPTKQEIHLRFILLFGDR